MANKSFSKMNSAEKLAHAQRVDREITSQLEGTSKKKVQSVEQRASLTRARDAARRVQKRLGGKVPGSKKPSESQLMQGFHGLVAAAKTAASLPGKMKAGLEKAREASQNSGTRSRRPKPAYIPRSRKGK